jgi:hypothetical protein
MTEATMCVANITAKGRRRRFVTGIVVFGAVAAAVVLGTPHAWRAALALPLWFASLCVVQAMAGT